MADELLNASFGELLPQINASTSEVTAIFGDVGASMKDVILTNKGPDDCIVTSNSASAVPTVNSVTESALIPAGAVVTLRKGLNVRTLKFICPNSTAKIWAQSTNGA